VSIWRDDRGFSLTDLLTGFAALGFVLAGVVSIQQASFSAFLLGTSKIATQQNARVALERLAREIRESTVAPTTALATAITVTHPDLNNTVTYSLVGTNLMRGEGTNPAEVFIAGVHTLAFSYFKGDGAPAPTAAEVRRVDITIQTRPEDQNVKAGAAHDTRAVVSTTVRLRNL
jgi:Tfp pilus assembly protein PilW